MVVRLTPKIKDNMEDENQFSSLEEILKTNGLA
jgi:hypothetical protein